MSQSVVFRIYIDKCKIMETSSVLRGWGRGLRAPGAALDGRQNGLKLIVIYTLVQQK